MFLLLRRKIRLANFQYYFIVNVAVTDALVSIAGVFRGLGIINGKFVGAPNRNKTVYCAVYTLFLNAAAGSVSLALIPLTLDRAIAIVFPLRHRSIVTKTTSVSMIIAVWISVGAAIISETASYLTGKIAIEYEHGYHRCIMKKDIAMIGDIFLYVVPFFLILSLYTIMMIIIVYRKRPVGRFLVTACGIILTNLLTVAPSTITMIWSIPLNYKLSQILTVTLYYTNAIFNSMIYLGAHPAARRYVTTLRSRYTASTMNTSAANRQRNSADVRVNSNVLGTGEIVCMPDINSQ